MPIDSQLKQFTDGAFEQIKNARVTYAQGTSGTFQSTAEDQAWERDTYVYSDRALRIAVSTGDDVAPTPPAGILIPNYKLIKLATLVDAEEELTITSVQNVLTIDAAVTGLTAADTIEQSGNTATVAAVDEDVVTVTGGTLFTAAAATVAMARDVTITNITALDVTVDAVPAGLAIGDTITQGVNTATIEAINALVLTIDADPGLTEDDAVIDMEREIEVESIIDQLVVSAAPVGIGAGDDITQGASTTTIVSVADDTYTVSNNENFANGDALAVRSGACGWASNDLGLARVAFCVDLDSGTDPEA